MSRYRALYDRNGLLAEFENDVCVWMRPDAAGAETVAGPQVIRDLEPYRSMIDGSIITGRKQHRDHLRAHNCIEVGNDTSHMKPRKPVPLPNRKELLHRLCADLSDRDMQRLVHREIEKHKR